MVALVAVVMLLEVLEVQILVVVAVAVAGVEVLAEQAVQELLLFLTLEVKKQQVALLQVTQLAESNIGFIHLQVAALLKRFNYVYY